MPFQSHFLPHDTCQDGLITNDDCMERGLDERGFDCSGLIIASACDVLGIPVSDWPREYRHIRQLDTVSSTEIVPEFGDITLFRAPEDHTRKHGGIYTGGLYMVHANARGETDTQAVIEGRIPMNAEVSVLELEKLAITN